MDKFSDENTCRICFKNQDPVYSLFCKRNGITPCEKLVRLGLKADENDAGPAGICCDCLLELDTTVNFLEKCEKSNQILAENSSRVVDFSEEIVNHKENLIIEFENNKLHLESRAAESIQDVHVESNVSKEAKSSEILGLDEARCEECGSRRRCRHWTPPATHTCPYCQKVFTRKFNFKLHLKRHSGERDWSCTICGASAVSRWLASRHCAPRRRRACPVPGCGKTYTTNTNLNTHLRVHSGERPFECSECGKKFTSKNTLNDHMRIHTGVLPYICPICGKRFRTNKLSSHMCTHGHVSAGVAPRHVCVVAGCGRRLASRAALQRHARAHRPAPAAPAPTAAPPHACALCAARYHHKQSLNKHVRKRHAQNPAPTEMDSTEMTKEIECDL